MTTNNDIQLEATGTLPIKLVPVKDRNGDTIVVDIWIGDQWFGSRRTIRYCVDWLKEKGYIK